MIKNVLNKIFYILQKNAPKILNFLKKAFFELFKFTLYAIAVWNKKYSKGID